MNKKAGLWGSVGLFCLSLTLVLGVRWIGFEPFVIPSGSMIPTLLINDHIVVSKYSFGFRWPFSRKWLLSPQTPQRGDVVVFRSIDQDDYYLIKRVVGLPGDRVVFDEAGRLHINGQVIPMEEWENHPKWSEADLEGPSDRYDVGREKLGEHEHAVLLERGAYRSTESGRVIPAGHIFLMGDNRDRSRDSRFWGDLPLENLLGKAQFVWLSCEGTVPGLSFICDPRTIRWRRFFHHIE